VRARPPPAESSSAAPAGPLPRGHVPRCGRAAAAARVAGVCPWFAARVIPRPSSTPATAARRCPAASPCDRRGGSADAGDPVEPSAARKRRGPRMLRSTPGAHPPGSTRLASRAPTPPPRAPRGVLALRLEATPTNSEFVGLASHELFVRSHGHPKRGIFGSLHSSPQ